MNEVRNKMIYIYVFIFVENVELCWMKWWNMMWGNACLLKCELYTLMWINWNMDIESELVMNWNVVVEMWVVYMNCEMLNWDECDVSETWVWNVNCACLYGMIKWCEDIWDSEAEPGG